jgi:hypothetical protein
LIAIGPAVNNLKEFVMAESPADSPEVMGAALIAASTVLAAGKFEKKPRAIAKLAVEIVQALREKLAASRRKPT